MSAAALQTLPPELLRHILLHADVKSLCHLRLTCSALRLAVEDEVLWRQLVQRRFRVSARVLNSRRLMAVGGVSWRELYANWHSSARMPTTRMSGTAHPAFARGHLNTRGVLLWVTVVSTDDCRLVSGTMRVRIILQNVGGGEPMRFHLAKASFHLTDATVIPANDRSSTYGSLQSAQGLLDAPGQDGTGARGTRRRRRHRTANQRVLPYHERLASPLRATSEGYSALVGECFIERAACAAGVGTDNPLNTKWRNDTLAKDDLAILTVDISMASAVSEVDALERLKSFRIPLSWGGSQVIPLVAFFEESVLWDNYERIPGGWWVRTDTVSNRY